jgi:two-component system, NtrC family, response regulator HydG
MPGSRLALVAADQRLAGALQLYFKKSLGEPLFQCHFDAIRDHLHRDTDGMLLLAVAVPADVEPARRLVQEISLRKLPPIILIVEGDDLGPAEELRRLDAHVAQRLAWPAGAADLLELVQDGAGRGRRFTGSREEAAEDVIARRLEGQTPSLLALAERLALAALHDVTVLLTGETGTGKTHLARLMHDCSLRKEHPFLDVPCGAQPANLVESAFFGHVRGAFTGADRARVGKFAAAGEGTLLLDEIDTLGLEQQAGLLRVIESGQFEPVGSNKTQKCQARIIVASNWNLEEAVRQGKFREDLYYRLNVMSFHLPPLRERVQDIAPLARAMAARFNTRFRKDLFDIGPETMAALESFPWPGNIRQLENAVQQAVLISKGIELLPEHLPPAVRDFVPELNGHGLRAPESLLRTNREMLERKVIQETLREHGYSRNRAAHALGISRVTLHTKMRKYGLMGSVPIRPNSA